MERNIILGGGLSGLIWAVYHPNSIVVEPGELGGMVHKNMGPMMIHHTPEVSMFMRKIGLPAFIRPVNVGYTRDCTNYSSSPPDDDFRDDYYHNSRLLSTRHKLPESTMSGNSSGFFAVDWPISIIIEKTIEYLRTKGTVFIKNKVEEIYYNSKEVKVGEQIVESDNIISTIPMTIFQQLVGESMVKPVNGLTKVFIDTGLFPTSKMTPFDYIYVVDPESSPENLTRLIVNKTVVEEFTIPLNEDPNMILDTRRYTKSSVLKGTIRLNKDIKSWRDIKFVGRTARWDHNIKINDVIKEAQEDVE